jgi:hypothetical protein
MTYAAATPHDPVEEIFEDVFMVRGSVQMNRLMSITRNMAIVRHAGELTLVDPIRLDADGERQLRALGEVKRILRLGPLHGLDDAYYADTFGAELWAPGPSETHPEPKLAVDVTPETPLPFPDAEIFEFAGTNRRESALLIRRHGGLLITCDSLQHYGDYRYNNWLASLLMPFIGFPKRMLVGPIWLKLMTPEGGSLESEFRRLLTLEFDSLLSAHGSLARGGAHAKVEAAVDLAFPH